VQVEMAILRSYDRIVETRLRLFGYWVLDSLLRPTDKCGSPRRLSPNRLEGCYAWRTR
jgi:hypothetical protein